MDQTGTSFGWISRCIIVTNSTVARQHPIIDSTLFNVLWECDPPGVHCI